MADDNAHAAAMDELAELWADEYEDIDPGDHQLDTMIDLWPAHWATVVIDEDGYLL